MILTCLHQWYYIFTDYIKNSFIVSLILCFVGVKKDCDKSLILTVEYNLFQVFGFDKGLFWNRPSVEALLLPVVMCGVVYNEQCGMKNVVLGDDYGHF